ncbi:MAG: type II toxin-antitoxin system VapB family antitoxin [Spirochaetota bacterium]
MRTNIEIDDELIDKARRLTGLRTKKDVVQEALRTLVRIREQGTVRTLRGKLTWEGDLDELRKGRVS